MQQQLKNVTISEISDSALVQELRIVRDQLKHTHAGQVCAECEAEIRAPSELAEREREICEELMYRDRVRADEKAEAAHA